MNEIITILNLLVLILNLSVLVVAISKTKVSFKEIKKVVKEELLPKEKLQWERRIAVNKTNVLNKSLSQINNKLKRFKEQSF